MATEIGKNELKMKRILKSNLIQQHLCWTQACKCCWTDFSVHSKLRRNIYLLLTEASLTSIQLLHATSTGSASCCAVNQMPLPLFSRSNKSTRKHAVHWPYNHICLTHPSRVLAITYWNAKKPINFLTDSCNLSIAYTPSKATKEL